MSFNNWHTADPDAVGQEAGEPPAPGTYDPVALIETSAFTSKKGEDWVRLRWRDEASEHEWDVILGFRTQAAANFTKREIRELGVNVDSVSSLDQLDEALKQVLGQYFEVEVVANGNFLNTYVRGRSGGNSNGFTPRTDVPVSTDDFAPVPAGGGIAPDDDIPF